MGDRPVANGPLHGASNTEQAPGAGERDGPDAQPPAGLDLVPDAEPRIEPVRLGGPNKPYEERGATYVPLLDDRPSTEHGLATWYGRKFHGHRTSSGEPYDMYAMTAAHPVLPIPSYAKVRNPANGREVVVRINDRGPFHSGRIIDLSYTAALKLGVLRGATQVEVQRITRDDIRTGAWRTSAPIVVAKAPPSGVAGLPETTGAPNPALQDVAFAEPPPARPDAPTALRAPTALLGLPIAESVGSPDPVTLVASPPSAAQQPDRPDRAAPTWWLQLGAFRERDAAAQLSRNVATGAQWLAPLLAVAADARWFRLQAGPYASATDARDAAERLRRDLQVAAMVLARP